jgi:hypothetical protein
MSTAGRPWIVAEVGAARRTQELEEQAARAEEGTAQLARELQEVRHTAEHTEAQLLRVGSWVFMV